MKFQSILNGPRPIFKIACARFVLTFFLLMMGGLPLLADSTGSATPATSQPSGTTPLSERQEIIRDRVGRLEDRMFQLSQALRKTEPDKAERLLEGLSRLRGEQVREQMARIVERLNENRLSDANDAQQAVMADLQSLLKQLMEDPDQIGERKSEIERLEAVRKELEALVQEQERELREAEMARAAQRRAEALEAAAVKVKDLLKRQQDAAGRTGQSSDLSAEATAQAEIRGATDSVATDVEAVAEAESGDSDSPAGKAQDAAKALKSASEKMESAEKSLRGDERDSAADKQGDAATELENALKNLEEHAKEIRKKLELEKQAEAQKETADKTRSLGDGMKGESGKAGEGKQGEKGNEGEKSESEESEESKPAPGSQSVQDAVPYQKDAAEELKKENAEKAIEKQEKAVENLKKAQEELEDRLDQLRKEQQEELLSALESRFRAMLSRQIECNKVTNRLAEVGPSNWKRSDQLELADLSQKQRWVGDQADEALFLLTEEGSTVILPTLIEQIRDDGREVAERLAAADAGDAVRVTQADLEAVLRDIIDAIERKQEEMENEEESGEQQGGDQNQPLLPGSAELKLLRACQLRVNKMTQQLQSDRAKPDAIPDEVGKRLKKLSERQDDVARMAKDMHESLRKAQ